MDDNLRDNDTVIPFAVSGYVVDRADPKGLHRVRVCVPGLLEPASAWARPVATLWGGSGNMGAFGVPDNGAEVVLLFLFGDLDSPVYLTGWPGTPGGTSEVPTEAQQDPPDNRVIATHSFRVQFDETEGARGFRITVPENEDAIEYDAEALVWRIKGTSAVLIESDGSIKITGTDVSINGRSVRPSDDAI